MKPTPIRLSHPTPPFHHSADSMLPAIGGFPASDRSLFLAGYSELCRIDLSGKRALEICGGSGKLAGALAEVFPEGEIIGSDLYTASGPEVDERLGRLPKLRYVSADAFDLSSFDDGSLDLVWGQAALHHLAHDLVNLSKEATRVLKPGGRFVFIFEPLGHNLVVSAIRAMRIAKYELGDESNLFLSQLEVMMNHGFSSCEVQVFNFLGYPMKALSDRFGFLCEAVQDFDSWMFNTFPGLKRYGANGNVIFTK